MNGEEHLRMPIVTEETSMTGGEVVAEGYGARGREKIITRGAIARAQLRWRTTAPAHTGYEVSRVAREEATWSMLAWEALFRAV